MRGSWKPMPVKMHNGRFIVRCVQECRRFVGFYPPFTTLLNVPLKKQALEGDTYGSFHKYNHPP